MNKQQLIEQQLGIRLGSSPVYTAKDLLVDCYQGKEHVIRDTTTDLRDLPFMESALDLTFKRDLEPWMIGHTVHHYDKSSAYLASCSSTNNGIGEPVHLDGSFPIVPGLPGIYRVTSMMFDSFDFPPIIEPNQEWVTNDVLLYAMSKGYDITILEAYVFENYERILGNRTDKRNWAKRLWNARQALKGTEAYSDMKVIALVGLGSFATSKEKYHGLRLIHPNWWADIVGKTRVQMLANIEKYGGRAPLIMAYVDGLFYLSRNANYRVAVPNILERQGQLGGYHHGYSFTLTQEIYEQAQGLAAGELVTLFNGVGSAITTDKKVCSICKTPMIVNEQNLTWIQGQWYHMACVQNQVGVK